MLDVGSLASFQPSKEYQQHLCRAWCSPAVQGLLVATIYWAASGWAGLTWIAQITDLDYWPCCRRLLIRLLCSRAPHYCVKVKWFIGNNYVICVKFLHSEDPYYKVRFILYTFFFAITRYNSAAHNARTFIPTNARTQTLPLWGSSKARPTNPRDWLIYVFNRPMPVEI